MGAETAACIGIVGVEVAMVDKSGDCCIGAGTVVIVEEMVDVALVAAKKAAGTVGKVGDAGEEKEVGELGNVEVVVLELVDFTPLDKERVG